MRRFFYLPNYPANIDATAESFLQQALDSDTPITLTDDIFHHWCRVLRAKHGDEAVFFDGHGGEYIVQLTQIEKKSATATIVKHLPADRNNDFHTHIALVMSRGDRMDYALQKATEMGVNSIQLLTSQHGEVSLKPNQVDKKMAHWQQVMLSACEQCGLNRPPLLLKPVSINDWLSGQSGEVSDTLQPLASLSYYQNLQKLTTIQTLNNQQAQSGDIDTAKPLRLVLAVPNDVDAKTSDTVTDTRPHNATKSIQQCLKNKHPKPVFILLIGAEGGLSDTEVSQAMSTQFLPWQIGERILRTETAPVAVLASLQTFAQLYSNKDAE